MTERIDEVEPEPSKVLAEQRARAILQETSDEWDSRPNGSSFLEKEFGNFRAVIRQKPELLYDKENRVVGVDAWVQLFNDKTGREIAIDPHRRIINPPTVPRSGISEVDDVDAQGKPIKRRIVVADAKKAFYEAVRDSVEGTPNAAGWRTRGTVTTVFATASDGWVQSDHSSSYSSARAGTGTKTFVADNRLTMGQAWQPDPVYYVMEGFTSFDTSAITDSDIVSAVSLDLYLLNDSSTTDFTAQAREYNWGGGISPTASDFVAGASLGVLTLMATIASNGIGATGAYKTFTSQAAFLTATNLKTGVVFLLFTGDRTVAGTTPTNNEMLSFASAFTSGTTQDPKLTITHNSIGSSPFFTSRPNRIWRLN